MAGNNAFNNSDSMDINELAALDTDISPELIEQLHQKLSAEVQGFSESKNFDVDDDTTLFEETTQPEPQDSTGAEIQSSDSITEAQEPVMETPELQEPTMPIEGGYDDDFIKKYKAKHNQQAVENTTESLPTEANGEEKANADINQLTNGNITEKTITQAQKEYNDSLDLLDGNVKYSKYVIYIDPQNVDFIESLTVKERKNLINNILREQDDVGMTRKKFRRVQAVIKHSVVAILTITLSIPIIYWAINASLEASINNYRRSQTNFQTLYKDHGKINAKQPFVK